MNTVMVKKNGISYPQRLPKSHLIVSFVLIALAEFIFWFILTKTGYMDVVNTYVRDCDFSLYDAFYTQCSLTFIVVSLISFLSNNTNDALWDDTIAYSLKKPFHTNFVALSGKGLIMVLTVK